MTDTDLRAAHRRLVGRMMLVVIGMFGFGFALVPLYDVFCDLTGLNGKTGELAEAEAVKRFVPDGDRWVTVEFLTSNTEQMPWEVRPLVLAGDSFDTVSGISSKK